MIDARLDQNLAASMPIRIDATRPRNAAAKVGACWNRSPRWSALSAKILTLQGDGDHAGARAFLDQYGKIGPELQSDLDRIQQKDIPVDIVFKQGREVLGL